MHGHEDHSASLAVDPVCGMKVSPGSSASVVHDGTRYWFCEPACAATFRDEPERWVATAPLAHDHHESHAAAVSHAGGRR